LRDDRAVAAALHRDSQFDRLAEFFSVATVLDSIRRRVTLAPAVATASDATRRGSARA